ncbi:MAG: helix-turn-helix transcriptional regulator [Bacteroidota bacterium]
MTLHNNLKEIRLRQALTQEQLARSVGVTRQTIIAIEKGKFVPSVKLALYLASALHSSIADIFWLENEQGEKG